MDKQYIIDGLKSKDPRGRGSFAFLLSTAEKKPELQQLIDDIENVDIDQVKQPKWVKTHLRALQDNINARPKGALTPEEIAAIMIEKSKR